MSSNKKPFLIAGPSASPQTLAVLAHEFQIMNTSINKFKSDEHYTELFHKQEKNCAENAQLLQGANVYILQSTGNPVGDNMQYLLLTAHTLKYYDAATVTAICPYMSYSRQDRPFDDRFTSVAAEFAAAQMRHAGIDRMVSLSFHSQAAIKFYEKQFKGGFVTLNPSTLFAQHIAARFGADAAVVSIGAPDGANKTHDEGQRRARELATALFGNTARENQFFISKEHTGVDETAITGFEGNVAGKHCIVVDDMSDGGGTMINAAKLLKEKGAITVSCYATHGVLTGNGLEKLASHPAVDHFVVTNSIPEALAKISALPQALKEKVDCLDVGTLLLDALKSFNTPAQLDTQKNKVDIMTAPLEKILPELKKMDGEALAQVFTQWRKKDLSVFALALAALSYFDIPRSDKMYTGVLLSAAAADAPHNNAYHNNHHFREVLGAMIRLVDASLNDGAPLTKTDICTCLIAAAGHDLTHDGKPNKTAFEAEDRASDALGTILAKAGIDDIDDIRTMIRVTDIGRYNGQESAHAVLKKLAAGNTADTPPELARLAADKHLCLMASLLSDADLTPSAGTGYTFARHMTQLLSQENPQIPDSDNTLHGFLSHVVGNGFTSPAGARLSNADFEKIHSTAYQSMSSPAKKPPRHGS
jgi:ribose-phosphate pyrophosphokinase